MTPRYYAKGMAALDFGGATGGYGNALSQDFNANLAYTCIDVDGGAIMVGKKLYKDFTFIHGKFPEDIPNYKIYDHVVCNAWFSQVTDWKHFLLTMSSKLRRFVSFSTNVRLDGTTVVDKDVPYFYYLDSGKRVLEVTRNLFELLNFLSIGEIQAQRILFWLSFSKIKIVGFSATPKI